jgi:hypothetical protein
MHPAILKTTFQPDLHLPRSFLQTENDKAAHSDSSPV